ncbi:MAG: metal ABC transporter solute-binding protein, Zn/Mn family [Cellvibrionales bacterium]
MKAVVRVTKILRILAFGCWCSQVWADELLVRPVILTTIKPLALIAASAVGEAATVEYLQSPAQSAHDLHLTPSMLQRIAAADLVIRVDPAFEQRLNKHLAKIPTQRLITASTLDLHWPSSNLPSSNDRSLERDLHFWLNPSNAEVLARRIQQVLKLPPRRLIDDATLRRHQRVLTPFADQSTIAYHDAYGHFASAFRLSRPTTIRDAAGHPQGLASHYAMHRSATDKQPSCVFVEAQYAGRDATAMAKNLGIQARPLDLLGIQITVDADAYSHFIERLVTQYSACFGAFSRVVQGA